jgi:hypothetical protein
LNRDLKLRLFKAASKAVVSAPLYRIQFIETMNAGDEPNRFATYEQVVEIVERQYVALWEKWFAKVPAIPAGLSVRTDVVDCGYSEEKNLLSTIFFGDRK